LANKAAEVIEGKLIRPGGTKARLIDEIASPDKLPDAAHEIA
jgi:hypothetical protein